MAVSLEAWQKRLEKHFADLAARREASGYRLFALEHNLTRADLKTISELLHSRLANRLHLGPHWLVWVVYATEIGYDYEGDEYWRSYEERTPGWRENASRPQLRDWFYKFKAAYYGVEPSGPWADWFSIIAWPVTHAILPRYLQLQLTRSLYRLRYRLASLEALSPRELGRLVAAESWDASSRFQAFLEQEELAGRIVLALLKGATPNDQSPIYPSSLQRIVSDLEQVRSAREWLNEAQRVVASRFKGAARSSGATPIHAEAEHVPEEHTAPMPAGINPVLLLRPSGAGPWSVVIETPSFGAIARLSPELRAFIASTRCRIAAAGGTWMPTGWLLFNSQRRVLKTWPDPSKPLIEFEKQNRTIDHLLASEGRLKPGPIWLCRIGSDGLAREVTGRMVRPGHQYILVSQGRLAANHSLITPTDVACAGIDANLLSLPARLSSQDIVSLERLGLRVALTLRIWPAGLSARGWDGEGHSEWLTTEAPCFGLVHDHPVEAYVLRLNDGAAQVIKAGSVGDPIFVRLQPLPAGKHFLSVKAHCSAPLRPAEGFVTLDVREPELWIPGTTSHAGLAVTLDPYSPSLDTFWEGNAEVSILGPEGRHVTCSISLSDSRGDELLSQQVGRFELPVLPVALSRKLASFTKEEKHAWAYLEASTGCLIINGDELGKYVVRLERSVKPVRWVCLGGQRTATLRLIDDTGLTEAAHVRFFSFGRPALPVRLPTLAVLGGWEAEVPGGLFTAQNAQHRDALVVSSSQISEGFRGLLANADLRDLEEGYVTIESILKLLDLWSDARLVGPLARIRRNHVTRSITSFLFARLYGSRWAEAEALYLSGRNSAYALRKVEAAVGGSAGFAATLRRDYKRMEEGTAPGARWFAEVASRYGVSSDPGLCKFALRLASQPHRLPSIFGSNLYAWLRRIGDRTILLRGARLLALLAAVEAGEGDTTVPGWQWS